MKTTPTTRGVTSNASLTSNTTRKLAAQPESSCAPSTAGTASGRRTRMTLASLAPHQLQGFYFDPPTDPALNALAEDMSKYGQREPVNIIPANNKAGLPGNTILDGHGRFAAARLLGWTDIDVVIRDDLIDLDADELERIYLQFNYNRKQLDQLAQARIALRFQEIEKHRPRGGLFPGEEAVARDRVGTIFGMSGRTLARYWNLLKAPTEVQRAFSIGKLKLVLAQAVGTLTKREQTAIVEAIARNTDAGNYNGIVQRFLPAPARNRPRCVTPDAIRFVRIMEKELSRLDGRLGKIHGPSLAPYAGTLQKLKQAIDTLITAAERPGGDLQATLSQFVQSTSAVQRSPVRKKNS